MLTGKETQDFAAALIEQYGDVTLAAAIRNARSAAARGELVAMLEWERVTREALRQMPAEVMYLA
jgi:hypothetical protein